MEKVAAGQGLREGRIGKNMEDNGQETWLLALEAVWDQH